MLFRWSLWGPRLSQYLEMLSDSIRSFRAVVGPHAGYVVHTDDPKAVSARIGSFANVFHFSHHPSPEFDSFGEATWGKWCPTARLAPGEIEVHVDADVFLLGRPDELFELSKPANADRFLALPEDVGEPWQRGAFRDRIPPDMPFVNAGFFAQGPAADVSASLRAEYQWWRSNRKAKEGFHDEQGALTRALVPAVRESRLTMLPTSRYKIVSPRSNPGQQDLVGVVLFHATYPDHPAWHRFRHLLPAE